jgi:glycosyltransferase involved in cell wall biosynthesis
MLQPQIPFTVAIPTMRRYTFLAKCLPQYLDNPLITCVVICDETGEDVKLIEKQPWGKHPKLRLHTNPKRLGIYYNKRRCMELSPTDWVAILDSDNVFPDEFFEALFDLWRDEGASTKTIYASGQIVRVFLKNGESEERTKHFAGMRISSENWNQVLSTPAWNFLLNDGNWIGHKSLLDAWPTDIPDELIRATDSIRIVRNFILKDKTYYVVPQLRYIHTVHDDSEWIKTEAESSFLLAKTEWRI